MTALSSVVTVLLLATPAPVEPGAVVTLAVKADGSARAPRQLKLDELPQQTVTHADAQLGKRVQVRGVSLARIVAELPAEPKLDLVLLRFANGMVVPLPKSDAAAWKRLDPFVARQIEVDGAWLPVGRFPSLARAPDRSDVRPHGWSGNRVLVAERWHPSASTATSPATFSPWDAVDSLTAIELVEAATYWAQFEVPRGSAAVARGARLFRESCVVCHSVRGEGGRFGWDFAEPDPIYSDRWMRAFRDGEQPFTGGQRGKDRLSTHVRFHAATGGARAMPVLSHLQPSDIDDLWQWIGAVAAKR